MLFKVKVKAKGRGGQYSLVRATAEMVQRRLYAGGWPARLWQFVPA
jgi:hypothetical protein